MFVVSKHATNFGTCPGFAASSSCCQSEYNGRVESEAEGKKSIIGLKGTLRRNSSSLSQQLNALEICHADATQIEINCTSSPNSPAFYIRVEVPTGEVGLIHFSGQDDSTHVFTPLQQGCGHGIWRFAVCTMDNSRETTHSEKSMNLDGVGTLFFEVFDDLEMRLNRQEFLHIAHCHTRRH